MTTDQTLARGEELADFVKLVSRMREAQGAYFKSRDRQALERSKDLERQVDLYCRSHTWEYDFVNDLAGRGDDYALSEKQNAVLNRIIQKINRSN